MAKRRCKCIADKTWYGPLQTVLRGRPGRRQKLTSKYVFHYRECDDAHFWHWQDQRMRLKPTPMGEECRKSTPPK